MALILKKRFTLLKNLENGHRRQNRDFISGTETL
jgi:hypothetical protein